MHFSIAFPNSIAPDFPIPLSLKFRQVNLLQFDNFNAFPISIAPVFPMLLLVKLR